MKTRGFGVKALRLASVTVLISGLWLLGSFRGSGRSEREAGAGVSRATASGTANSAGAKQDSKWAEAYGRLPLSFEENVGQTAQEVRYVSHGSGYELFLTPQEAVVALRSPEPYDLSPLHRFRTIQAIHAAARARTMTAIRMSFEGTTGAPQISGTERLTKKTNYFIGNDPKKWRTDVASYGQVKYSGVYPGVDVVFYGDHGRLEYDFVVAPGANPRAIRLKLQGARKLRLNARGDVVLSVPGGELMLQRPVVYQMVKGERHEIAGGYVLARDHVVTFSVPDYERSEPLILDPVLNYSTYLGGSLGASTVPLGTGIDSALGIAIDSAGNAYVAGTTYSTNFPTTAANAFNAGPLASNPNGAVFVTEMNPTGTAEIYSTYLAGSNGELATAVALDSTGKIYVTGQAFSSDFPTTANALKQSPNAGDTALGTSFVSKIDPTLSGAASLVYSSYIGGTSGDFANGIAVGAGGNVYVVGITFSSPGAGLTQFPVTAGAFQSTLNTVNGNAFLTRIDTSQSGAASLIYSTYLGGAGANAAAQLGFGDDGFGVAVDASSNAYIVGVTTSTDFPTTTNAFRTTVPTNNSKGTAFVARIDTTKSGAASLIYSTYLGGEVLDEGFGIGLGPNSPNNVPVAYVTGLTQSLAFPTLPAGAFQKNNPAAGGGNSAAFVSLIDTGATGSTSLTYSTYLGGTVNATGFGIRADAQGNAYVGGGTASLNFPLTAGAFEAVFPAGAPSVGFLTKLNPGGNGAADLVYSTFFGGSGSGSNPDQVFGVAIDGSSPPNAYITGETFSTAATFPIFPAGAFQKTLGGTSDAFIAKLSLEPTLIVSPTSLNFGAIIMPNTSAPQTVTLTNNTNATIAFTSATIPVATATPAAAATDYVVSANTCAAGIPAGVAPANQCTVSVTFKPSVVGPETATLDLTDADSTSPQKIALSGTGTNTPPDFTITATAPAPSPVKAGSPATFTVTVTPIGGFSSAVTIACVEPAGLNLSTCTPTTSPITPNGGPISTVVTVTTTAPSMMIPPPFVPTRPLRIWQIVPFALALILLFLIPTAKRLRLRLGMAAATLALLVLAGCSGPGTPPKPGTTPGTYQLTVTGTAGATMHTVTPSPSVTVN